MAGSLYVYYQTVNSAVFESINKYTKFKMNLY